MSRLSKLILESENKVPKNDVEELAYGIRKRFRTNNRLEYPADRPLSLEETIREMIQKDGHPRSEFWYLPRVVKKIMEDKDMKWVTSEPDNDGPESKRIDRKSCEQGLPRDVYRMFKCQIRHLSKQVTRFRPNWKMEKLEEARRENYRPLTVEELADVFERKEIVIGDRYKSDEEVSKSEECNGPWKG